MDEDDDFDFDDANAADGLVGGEEGSSGSEVGLPVGLVGLISMEHAWLLIMSKCKRLTAYNTSCCGVICMCVC